MDDDAADDEEPDDYNHNLAEFFGILAMGAVFVGECLEKFERDVEIEDC